MAAVLLAGAACGFAVSSAPLLLRPRTAVAVAFVMKDEMEGLGEDGWGIDNLMGAMEAAEEAAGGRPANKNDVGEAALKKTTFKSGVGYRPVGTPYEARQRPENTSYEPASREKASTAKAGAGAGQKLSIVVGGPESTFESATGYRPVGDPPERPDNESYDKVTQPAPLFNTTHPTPSLTGLISWRGPASPRGPATTRVVRQGQEDAPTGHSRGTLPFSTGQAPVGAERHTLLLTLLILEWSGVLLLPPWLLLPSPTPLHSTPLILLFSCNLVLRSRLHSRARAGIGRQRTLPTRSGPRTSTTTAATRTSY